MADVFITSTLKSDWNLSFASTVSHALESRGISCHLPQRDTNQAGTGLQKCHQNYTAIREARVLLGVLCNATINAGCEFGFAYAIGKPIVFITDEKSEVPVMALCMPFDVIRCQNLDILSEYIDPLVSSLHRALILQKT